MKKTKVKIPLVVTLLSLFTFLFMQVTVLAWSQENNEKFHHAEYALLCCFDNLYCNHKTDAPSIADYIFLGYSPQVAWNLNDGTKTIYIVTPAGEYVNIADGTLPIEMVHNALLFAESIEAPLVEKRQICCGIWRTGLWRTHWGPGGSHLVPHFFFLCGYETAYGQPVAWFDCQPNNRFIQGPVTRIAERHFGVGCNRTFGWWSWVN